MTNSRVVNGVLGNHTHYIPEHEMWLDQVRTLWKRRACPVYAMRRVMNPLLLPLRSRHLIASSCVPCACLPCVLGSVCLVRYSTYRFEVSASPLGRVLVLSVLPSSVYRVTGAWLTLDLCSYVIHVPVQDGDTVYDGRVGCCRV